MAAILQIEGLKEFRKTCKAWETDVAWKPALKGVYGSLGDEIALKIVAAASGSRMGSEALSTIVGKGTTTFASIKAFTGRAGVYAPGFNFGSVRYRQFPSVQKPDYYLYATIEAEKDHIQEAFFEAIDDALSAEDL